MPSTDPNEYKPTFFDRHGPDGASRLRAAALGVSICGITIAAFVLQIGPTWWEAPVGVAAGIVGAAGGWLVSEAIGGGWKRVMVDGSSTPSVADYSFQQALVMQGRIDEALASFEAVIAEQPTEVTPRIKAAELYIRERSNHQRAAALLREVQRIPSVTTGEYVYVTNRLVDLLLGPLEEPKRALVELRRLIELYPGTEAAEHALRGLAELKARLNIAST
jgi:hypothetical protein